MEFQEQPNQANSQIPMCLGTNTYTHTHTKIDSLLGKSILCDSHGYDSGMYFCTVPVTVHTNYVRLQIMYVRRTSILLETIRWISGRKDE